MTALNFEQKWQSLNNREILSYIPNLKISDVKIKNPDNPAKLINTKLIGYEI